MKMVTTKAIAKVAAVATGLAMATSMLTLASTAYAASLTSAQVSSILSLLTSFGADSGTIANVSAALTGTPSTGSMTSGGTMSGSCSFTKDLKVGSSGADVTCLQNALIAKGYLSASATGYFGALTKAAVIKWQTAASVSPAAGYFGAKSRAAWGSMATTTTTTTTTTTATTTTTTTTATTTPTGSGLKVSLSSASPNGTVLVAGQGIGDLGDFVFTNPTSASVSVTALSFKRIGVSNDSAMTNVYLFNNGIRLTDSAGVSSSAFSFNNAAGLFSVPAGGTYTVSVRSDIATGTSGQQIGVQLVSATASTALDSSVSLPISSGYQTVSAATLAGVSYGGTVSPSSTSISPQVNYPVWQNTLSVSTNPVKLQSVKFTNLGSIDSSYVKNLRLYVDGVQAGTTTVALGTDRTVTFDLSANPLTMSTQSHTMKLLSDITGGASRTIVMSIQRSSDGMFVDNQLSQPVTPTNNGSTFTAITAGTITMNAVTSTAGVSVSLDPASPTANVAVGASSVKWATYDMLASGENVKVTDLYVYATDSVDATGGLQNGKIFLNGVQVGSTKNIGKNAANETDFSMGSSLILPAGQTATVDVYGDAKNTAGTNLAASQTVTITLDSVSNNAQGQSSLTSTTVPGAATAGNAITIAASSLTATKYTGYGAQTIIAGANSAKLGAFTLSTGSTEGITVNTIAISMTSANAASITNLTLKDDATGTQLGTIITTPTGKGTSVTSGDNDNSFALNYDIPTSSTKTIDIYANVLAGANAGTVQLSVDAGTTGTGDITGSSASATLTALQSMTVGSGLLTVAKGANYQTSNNIIAGTAAANVGEFTFSAQNSAFTVTTLAILVPNSVATSVTNVTLSYSDVNGVSKTATQSLSVSALKPYATAAFSGLTMYVPANSTGNLDVSIGVPTIASGATSGANLSVYLDAGATSGTFQALNSAGAATTTVNSGTNLQSGGTFYARKTIPTFAVVAQPLVTVPSSGTPIYKFSISADPGGNLEWSKLVFNVSTSSTNASQMITGAYLTDDASGVSLVDNTSATTPAANSASTTATSITVDLTKNATQPMFQTVAAGATKTYDLYGTIAGFTTGSTLTVSLASDAAAAALGSASATLSGNNIVWSDRSASPHTSPATGVTGSADFTNGYLLKNFTSNAVTYSK